MALPTQMIGGLISGMDTNSIINQLMEIERIQVKKLEQKRGEAELQLEAYRGVNSLLMEYSSAASKLAENATWNTKTAVSNNDSLLTASALDIAVPGVHQFKVAQLASNAKFMSSGFATMDDPILPMGIGTEMVEEAYGLNTNFDDYNGGAGVGTLGKIIIRDTDNPTNFKEVDLTGCEDMSDMASKIFTAAKFDLGFTSFSFDTYNGIGFSTNGLEHFTIEDFDATDDTATRLNLVGLTSVTGHDFGYEKEGDDPIFYEWTPGATLPAVETAIPGTISIENALGRVVRDTEVKALNGGKGIYHGAIRVVNSMGNGVEVDLSTCETLNDIAQKINTANGVGVEVSVSDNELVIKDMLSGGGTVYVQNVGAGTTADDLGLTNLTQNVPGEYTGTNINQMIERTSIKMLRDGRGINDGELGNIEIIKGGVTYTADLSHATTVGDIMFAMENAKDDAENIISGLDMQIDGNRLVAVNTDGVDMAIVSKVEGGETNRTAEDLGLASADAVSTTTQNITGYNLLGDLNSVQIGSLMGQRSFSQDSTIESLGMAVGEDLTVTDKNGQSVTYTVSAGDTIKDMMEAINNTSDGAEVVMFLDAEIGGFTIGDTSSATEWVFNDTPLTDVQDYAALGGTQMRITNGDGVDTTVDIAGATTIGDVLSIINSSGAGVTASINSTKTGINIVDNTTGSGLTSIHEVGGGHVAEFFGLLVTGDGGISGIPMKQDPAAIAALGDLTVSGTGMGAVGFDAGNSVASGAITGLKGNNIFAAGINGVQAPGVHDAGAAGEITSSIGSIGIIIDGVQTDLDFSDIKADSSMNDLIKKLNTEVSALNPDITFKINKAQNGIEVTNSSAFAVSFVNAAGSTAASDLGLTNLSLASGKTGNAGDLDTQWVTRGMKLSELTKDKTFSAGSINITNSLGGNADISLIGCDTVGDVIDAINGSAAGVTASINSTGDGIRLIDDSGGEGNITVGESSGGTTASKLGLIGTSFGELDGSFEKTLTIDDNDSLRDVMNNVAYSGLDVQCSIINDGSDFAPYRLVITSKDSGSRGDLLIDTDISAFSFDQTSKGRDAVVLYGNSASGVSPVMMTSPENTNNAAVLGIDLEFHNTSDEWVTLTVGEEKEAATEGINTLVGAYNTMCDLIDEFDDFDSETSKGNIFFADSNIRSLMDTLTDAFFTVTDTDNGGMSMWYDLGVKFNDEGKLEVDQAVLSAKISSSFDAVRDLMLNSLNVCRKDLHTTVQTTDKGIYDPTNAINGNNDIEDFGSTNGFESAGEIPDGGYQYTVNFDKIRTLDKLNIYHPNSKDYPAEDYALENFMVEYLNPNNNQWTELRNVTNNKSPVNYMGFMNPTAAKGVRITATSSNADDNKFRIAEIEAFEPHGLGANQEATLESLTDSISGWFVGVEENLKEQMESIDSQIEKVEEKLEQVELNHIRTYTNMESALANITAQGDYFAQQAASWSGSK